MQPWHCRPRDTTEISTISSLLPATIIVCAPTTHDQESVGTIIVAGLSVALARGFDVSCRVGRWTNSADASLSGDATTHGSALQ